MICSAARHRIELTEIHADYPGDTFMPRRAATVGADRREDHPANDRTRPFQPS
jgi:hypothetical protein